MPVTIRNHLKGYVAAAPCHGFRIDVRLIELVSSDLLLSAVFIFVGSTVFFFREANPNDNYIRPAFHAVSLTKKHPQVTTRVRPVVFTVINPYCCGSDTGRLINDHHHGTVLRTDNIINK